MLTDKYHVGNKGMTRGGQDSIWCTQHLENKGDLLAAASAACQLSSVFARLLIVFYLAFFAAYFIVGKAVGLAWCAPFVIAGGAFLTGRECCHCSKCDNEKKDSLHGAKFGKNRGLWCKGGNVNQLGAPAEVGLRVPSIGLPAENQPKPQAAASQEVAA